MASTAPFTPQQIASVSTGNPVNTAPKIDLNAPAPLPNTSSNTENYGSEVLNNLGSTFNQGGKNVVSDIGNEPNLVKNAGGSNLAKTVAPLATAGHVAGDVAGTAGGIIGSFITPLLSDNIKSKIGDVTKAISDKVNAIPGMTSEIAKGLGDVFNTATLLGGEDAEPVVKEGIEQGTKNVSEALTPEEKTIPPTDTLSSRIKDATPTYSKDMNLTNVISPDTTDEAGNVTKGVITPRVQGEGKGLTGERPVTTSASEHAAGTEMNNIKGYPDKGTNLEKGLAVQKAISSEAEGMRSGLQEEDKANPLDTNAEKTKVINLVKQNLPEEIREKMGILSPEDQAYMQDMQERLGVKSPPEGFDTSASKIKLPKTAAGRYFGKVGEALNNYDGTREGKLDLRQNIDSAYKEARGKLAFGSDSQNELDETHTDIRNGLNKDLSQSTKNTDIQSSLRRQSNLYNGLKTLTDKSQEESSTKFGRLEQKHPSLKTLIRIAQRQGIYLPIHMAEGAVGLDVATKFLKSAISGK